MIESRLLQTDHPTMREEPEDSIHIEDIDDESKYPLQDAHHSHEHLTDHEQ